jgi:hypothetical protein
MQASEIPDYEPVLKTKNGNFQFVIKELYIKGTGDTPSKAYKNLLKKKEAIIKEFRDEDALPDLPPVSSHTRASEPRFELGVFALKGVIIGLTILVIMIVGVLSLTSAIESTTSGKGVLKKIERELGKLGDPSRALSPKKEEEIRHNLRAFVIQVKPFIDELAPLFQCPAPENAPGDSVCREKAK